MKYSLMKAFELTATFFLTEMVLIGQSTLAANMTQQDCLKTAQIEQKINLSAGVYTEKAQVAAPLHITLPAVVDDKTYFECLVRNQLVDQNSTARYLAKQDECRTQTRLLQVKRSSGNTRIGTSNDTETFDACMGSDIGVEVLESSH